MLQSALQHIPLNTERARLDIASRGSSIPELGDGRYFPRSAARLSNSPAARRRRRTLTMAAANKGKPSRALIWAPLARKHLLQTSCGTLPLRASKLPRGLGGVSAVDIRLENHGSLLTLRWSTCRQTRSSSSLRSSHVVGCPRCRRLGWRRGISLYFLAGGLPYLKWTLM